MNSSILETWSWHVLPCRWEIPWEWLWVPAGGMLDPSTVNSVMTNLTTQTLPRGRTGCLHHWLLDCWKHSSSHGSYSSQRGTHSDKSTCLCHTFTAVFSLIYFINLPSETKAEVKMSHSSIYTSISLYLLALFFSLPLFLCKSPVPFFWQSDSSHTHSWRMISLMFMTN